MLGLGYVGGENEDNSLVSKQEKVQQHTKTSIYRPRLNKPELSFKAGLVSAKPLTLVSTFTVQ